MSMIFKRVSPTHGNEILFPAFEPDCNLLASTRINTQYVEIKKGEREGQYAMALIVMNDTVAERLNYSIENGLMDKPGSPELQDVWWARPVKRSADTDGDLPFGVVVYVDPRKENNAIEVICYRNSFVGSECTERGLYLNARSLPLMFAANAFDHDMETIVRNCAKQSERAIGHWFVLNLDKLAEQDLNNPDVAFRNATRGFFSGKQRIEEY